MLDVEMIQTMPRDMCCSDFGNEVMGLCYMVCFLDYYKVNSIGNWGKNPGLIVVEFSVFTCLLAMTSV